MAASKKPAEDILFEQVWLEGHLESHLEAVYGGDPVRLVGSMDPSSLTYTKLAVARAAGRVSRAGGHGGGTTAPGKLLLRLAPRAISTLAARLADGVVLVSGTNGKTTTARMLAAILEADGRTVVHNRTGANTNWGVGAALAQSDGDIGLFEVDEAWLPLLTAELRPRLVVLGNLSRDRLDRYGELEQLRTAWCGLVRGASAPRTIVVNADDPLLAGPGGVLDHARADSILFGVEDRSVGSPAPEHPREAHSCAACGGPIRYSRAFVGHLGHYGCERCGRSRPGPSVSARAISGRGLDGTQAEIEFPGGSLEVRLAQPGLHNVYNALAAAAAAVALGLRPGSIRTGLASMLPPFGRSETITVSGRPVHLCLVKNPAGANATFTVLQAERRQHPLHLWLALNDGWADGRDVSWIWDADFERLAGVVGAVTCSGRRANELALRTKYAGWNCPIEANDDLDASFAAALARAPGPLIALPTYSALLEMRRVLNRHGVSVSDWGTTARAAI